MASQLKVREKSAGAAAIVRLRGAPQPSSSKDGFDSTERRGHALPGKGARHAYALALAAYLELVLFACCRDRLIAVRI